jgi:glycerate-2-kinase
LHIKNKEHLIVNTGQNNRKISEVLLNTLESALLSVEPQKLVRNHLKIVEDRIVVDDNEFDINSFKNIYVIGGGKASGAMASEVSKIFGDRISAGIVNVQRGTESFFDTGNIELNEASHPIPDENSIDGVKGMLKLTRNVSESDLVICLISGGGSALMTLPISDITIKDIQQLTHFLLGSGAPIEKLNIVRKHISSIKGGQLAKKLYPSQVISLIISDVVGDSIQSIASGPTAPDKTTFKDASDILQEYGVWDKCPNRIQQSINKGLAGELDETPKPGDGAFQKVLNIIIGGGNILCNAAEKNLKEEGFNTLNINNFLNGEAREAGSNLLKLALNIKNNNQPVKKPAAVIAGGETTVILRKNGKGGRNQEVGLSFAMEINGIEGIVMASMDSDGKDGNSDAAGVLVDGSTIMRGIQKDLEPSRFLEMNDSYSFFDNVGGLLMTGNTLTNVNDIAIMVIT